MLWLLAAGALHPGISSKEATITSALPSQQLTDFGESLLLPAHLLAWIETTLHSWAHRSLGQLSSGLQVYTKTSSGSCSFCQSLGHPGCASECCLATCSQQPSALIMCMLAKIHHQSHKIYGTGKQHWSSGNVMSVPVLLVASCENSSSTMSLSPGLRNGPGM
jgi:hypothetical protein